jgi:hypothetical protein
MPVLIYPLDIPNREKANQFMRVGLDFRLFLAFSASH